jgi:uncharacterized membrane protein YraQ (UPF0718 family)
MYPESFHVTSFLGTTKIEARHYPYKITWLLIVFTLSPLWILIGVMVYYAYYYYALGALMVSILIGIIWYLQAQAKTIFLFHKSRLEVADQKESNVVFTIEYKYIKEVYIDVLKGEVVESKLGTSQLPDTYCLMVKTSQQDLLVTNKMYSDETMYIAKMLKDRMVSSGLGC